MIQIKKGAYTISTIIGKDKYVINMRNINNIKQFGFNDKITMLLPLDDITQITINNEIYDIFDLTGICFAAYHCGKIKGIKGFAIETKNKIIISKTM